ncbi:hypothetical protein [Peribacillus simplex]|nr:hypothetical protein [Peribacillus simplex]
MKRNLHHPNHQTGSKQAAIFVFTQSEVERRVRDSCGKCVSR